MLTADDHPMPVRAEALKFPADATLDQAVEIFINDALGQFVANWPALTETHDQESIHQMRVALRCLRSALALSTVFCPAPNSKSSGQRRSRSLPSSRRHGIGTRSK